MVKYCREMCVGLLFERTRNWIEFEKSLYDLFTIYLYIHIVLHVPIDMFNSMNQCFLIELIDLRLLFSFMLNFASECLCVINGIVEIKLCERMNRICHRLRIIPYFRALIYQFLWCKQSCAISTEHHLYIATYIPSILKKKWVTLAIVVRAFHARELFLKVRLSQDRDTEKERDRKQERAHHIYARLSHMDTRAYHTDSKWNKRTQIHYIFHVHLDSRSNKQHINSSRGLSCHGIVLGNSGPNRQQQKKLIYISWLDAKVVMWLWCRLKLLRI